MKWILIGVAVVVALVLVAVVVGLFIPKDHVARTRAIFRQKPDALWKAITDVDRWPEWNAAVRSITRRPNRDGREVFLTVGSWGEMETVVELSEPPRRYRTRVADANGTFEGSWTYEIEPLADGSSLTVTERGSVSNPVFRFMMLFHDNYSTMSEFLRTLAAKFGETVEIAKVAVVDEATAVPKPARS